MRSKTELKYKATRFIDPLNRKNLGKHPKFKLNLFDFDQS